MTAADDIRLLTAYDLDWVAELTRRRRESLASQAQRFWRPAPGADGRHREFLAGLIENPDVLSVRNGQGFLIALDQARIWLVDDAVVSDDDDWAGAGMRLLHHAQKHCGALRFVVPVFEAARMSAGLSAGLAPVEYWWHRDLDTSAGAAVASVDADVLIEGATGRLVPAPPIYDPGGPVLLVTEIEGANSLTDIEAEAAARGAAVSVVNQRQDDEQLAELLSDAGYVLTTAFCEGSQR